MIEYYSFGKIIISGTTYTADLKIIEGKVVSGWWRSEGHAVDVDDVQDILAAKPACLVIGKGKPGLMRVTEQLRQQLQHLAIDLIEEPSATAIHTFNSLMAQNESVAAGFHLTC